MPNKNYYNRLCSIFSSVINLLYVFFISSDRVQFICPICVGFFFPFCFVGQINLCLKFENHLLHCMFISYACNCLLASWSFLLLLKFWYGHCAAVLFLALSHFLSLSHPIQFSLIVPIVFMSMQSKFDKIIKILYSDEGEYCRQWPTKIFIVWLNIGVFFIILLCFPHSMLFGY